MNSDPSELALSAINRISAMVAYWNNQQLCVFSNDAYREWFGKTPKQMRGMSMEKLLGPLYAKNLPYILGALKGDKQIFERQIPTPGGEVRESVATYTPDIVDGVVSGFRVHVADVTMLREREKALQTTITERDAALAEIRTLRGLLPICLTCKSIRDDSGDWHSLEKYVTERTDANFSHGICPSCVAKVHSTNKG